MFMVAGSFRGRRRCVLLLLVLLIILCLRSLVINCTKATMLLLLLMRLRLFLALHVDGRDIGGRLAMWGSHAGLLPVTDEVFQILYSTHYCDV